MGLGGPTAVSNRECKGGAEAISEDASERGLEDLSTRAAEDESVLSTFAQMGSRAPDSNVDSVDGNRGVSVAADAPTRRKFVSALSRCPLEGKTPPT
jgi:hypothetical protein